MEVNYCGKKFYNIDTRGSIFSRVQPFYERAVSNLDRSMYISIWVQVTQSLFIERSHMTKNRASGSDVLTTRHYHYMLAKWHLTN
jgi:hypothetical protein